MKYFDPVDLLSLATASDVIVTQSDGGAQSQFVEVLGPGGFYVPEGAVAIRPRSLFNVSFTLVGGTLTLNFGVAIQTNYFLLGASVSCASENHPTASLNFAQFTAPAMFNAADSGVAEVAILGGLGVVNLFGATAAGAIRSSLNISTQQVETLNPTGGDLQVGGFALYGLKREVTIESTSAITTPVGAKVTASPTRASANGPTIFVKTWFDYLGT
jgi:hypothetical protein